MEHQYRPGRGRSTLGIGRGPAALRRPDEILAENKWRAARRRLEGDLVDHHDFAELVGELAAAT